MGEDDRDQPTFVRSLAYSTGLRLGRFLVEIIGDLIGARPRKGNRMSTAKADVLELLEEGADQASAKEEVVQVLDALPEDCSLEDVLYALSVRSQIRQGIRSLENEPTYTHEEVEQSLSRWLTG